MPETRGRTILRYGLVFAALALAGLAVWAVSTPAMAVLLFGESGYEAAYSSPVYGFLGLPLLALPPLISGFVLPKGFFLWGVAAVLAYVPGGLWTYLNAGPEVTFQTPDPGSGQILGLVFVEVAMIFVLAIVCTAAAGVGAALRALVWWRKGTLRRNLQVARQRREGSL